MQRFMFTAMTYIIEKKRKIRKIGILLMKQEEYHVVILKIKLLNNNKDMRECSFKNQGLKTI